MCIRDSIQGFIFKEIINSTLFAVSRDDLKPSLTGVLFRFNDSGLIAVATDGHRLVKIIKEDYKAKSFTGDIVVPKKFLSYLSTFLSNDDILLSIGETHMTATIKQDTIISRTINEVFPEPFSPHIIVNPESKSILVFLWFLKEIISRLLISIYFFSTV